MINSEASFTPRYRLRFSGLAIALIIASVLVAPPIDAQANGTVELVAQSVWVPPSGTFDIEVAAVGPTGATVELSIYPRVRTRISFRSTITAGPQGVPLFTSEPTVITGSTVVAISVPIDENLGSTQSTIADAGVYPVEVSLLNIDGTRIDRFTTHLVLSPETIADDEFALAVALTIPLDTDVTLGSNGERRISVRDQGRLDALTNGLQASSTVPVSVSISPETLAALDNRSLNNLRSALTGRLLLPRPYVDLDPASWLNAGLDSDFINALGVGLTTTDAILDHEVATSLWMANSTLTPTHLATLGGLGYEKFVLNPDNLESLEPTEFPLSLAQQFLIEDANGRRYPAAASDALLLDRFPQGVDPELAAHQLLAELTVIASDQPGLARGVVVTPPHDWSPDAGFLRTVLGGLASHPSLDPVDLDTWFQRVGTASETGQRNNEGFFLDRELRPDPAVDLSDFSAHYTSTAAGLSSFGSVVGRESAALAELNDLLLVAGSSHLTPAKADEYLSKIETIVVQTAQSVAFDLPGRVTFAARDGDVPLVVENNLNEPISVLVTLASDKLEFPDGIDTVLELEPGTNRFSVSVSARSSGDSVLDLAFSSPDRVIDLGNERVVVRSTALSGVALIIAAVALLFLLVWWLRSRNEPTAEVSETMSETSLAGNVATPDSV